MRLFHLCKCESTSSIGGKRRDGTARQCPLPALCRSQRRDVSKPDLPGSRHSVGLSPVRATRYSVESDVHSRPDRADTHPLVGLRSPRTIGVRNHFAARGGLCTAWGLGSAGFETIYVRGRKRGQATFLPA